LKDFVDRSRIVRETDRVDRQADHFRFR
jgi:hypothetical protein